VNIYDKNINIPHTCVPAQTRIRTSAHVQHRTITHPHIRTHAHTHIWTCAAT